MKYLCEYLSRINSLSVCLESENNIDKVRISAKTILIESGTQSIVIPVGVALSDHTLEPHKPEISLRVPTAERYTPHNWQFNVPWQAKDLLNCDIRCRSCDTPFASPKSLKQLPSEYWAELMEFWHCHKPNETSDHSKNYNITFDPVSRQPLVGDTYLKVHPDDINCSHFDPERVWKWQLSVDSIKIKSYVFMAAFLRELVNSHAIFTFLLEDDQTRILVWIFNVQAQYTLTGGVPQNGLKVYYSTEKSDIPPLMETRGEVETVSIPREALIELVNELNSTNERIPPTLKGLNGFSLGFIADN